jgi:ribosomal protein S18 acetylase RimI-like enzyme
MSLYLKKVTQKDIQKLRKIRNKCRQYMTRNKNKINKHEQRVWYKNLNQNELVPYLFYKNNKRIGYGIIRIEEDHCLVTGGLVNKMRNRGLGFALFTLLCEESLEFRDEVRLEVLKTNTRAFNLYKKINFVVVSESDTLYCMVRK